MHRSAAANKIAADVPPIKPAGQHSHAAVNAQHGDSPSASHDARFAEISPPNKKPLMREGGNVAPPKGKPSGLRHGRWVLWPSGPLKQTACECQGIKHPERDASYYIAYNYTRLKQTWLELTLTEMTQDITDAALRVLYQLRREGHEMFHVAGWQTHHAADAHRSEVSLLLMVPCNDASTGWHRWVGEVLIHRQLRDGKGHESDSVATRYATDPNDWTFTSTTQFYDDEQEPKFSLAIQYDGSMSALQVADRVWEQVTQRLPSLPRQVKSELKKRMGRATKELTHRGEDHLAGFAVKKLYKRDTKANDLGPCVTVSLYCTTASDMAQANASCARAEPLDPFEGVSAAAVIVIEPELDGMAVKPLRVVYDGEWPIAHQYPTKFPPPDLTRLAADAIAAPTPHSST